MDNDHDETKEQRQFESDSLKELAKAAQEVAKVTPRILESVDNLGGFLYRAFGLPVEQASGMLTDWLKYKRTNLSIIRQRIEEKLEKLELAENKIIPVPVKYSLPLINGLSMEDDPLLQDMWAGLIVNSIDPEKRQTPNRTIITILSELEPLDAAILRLMVTKTDHGTRTDHPLFDGIHEWEIKAAFGVNGDEFYLSITNLERLNLIYSAKEAAILSEKQVDSNMLLRWVVGELGHIILSRCSAFPKNSLLKS